MDGRQTITRTTTWGGGHEDRIAIGIGVAIGGIVTFIAANYEMRWIMLILILALVTAVFAVVPNKHRLLFGIYLLAFQADLNLYLLHRSESGSIGTSGPPGIRLPFVFLAAMAYAAYEVFTGRLNLGRIDWGQPVTKYFAWLVVLALLSLIAAPERFIGLCAIFNLVQLWLIYLVTLNVLRSEDDVRRAMNLLMVSLLIQCLLYFLQVSMGTSFDLLGEVRETGQGGLPRHGGTVSMRAADFASFIMPLTLIATARNFTATTISERRKFGVLTSFGVAAIILTFTRAAWVGTLMGSTVLLVMCVRRRMLSTRTLAKLGAVAIMLVIAFFPLIKQRLGDNHSSAFDEREALMQMAQNIIVARPVLGAGIGNYSFVVRDYLTRDLEDKWLWIVHNNYLLRAAENGIPALLLYLALLWAMVRRAIRSTHTRDPALQAIGLGWTCGMIALVWEMYWDIWQGFPYNALMWMLWGMTGAMLRIRSEAPDATAAATPR